MKRSYVLYSQIRKIWTPIPVSSMVADLFKSAEKIKSDADRLQWLEDLLRWIKKDAGDASPYARLKFLIQQLELRPEWCRTVIHHLHGLLSESSLTKFFLYTGYAEQHGLLHETGRRLIAKVVPAPPENDALELLRSVFRTADDLEWIAGLPREQLQQLLRLLQSDADYSFTAALRAAAGEAVQVFGIQLAHLGLSADVSRRSGHVVPSGSPFLQLQQELELIRRATAEAAPAEIQRLITQCQRGIELVYADMELNGTSVGLVYRLEVMSAALGRIRVLTEISGGSTPLPLVQTLLTDTAEAAVESRSVFGHINQRMHLISRKIAERNGQSADHYIARSTNEKRALFVSALKGGAIVVAMTVAKLAAHAVPIPALILALIDWIIYAAGFLAMQFTHSTLATKLPSYTASLLARLMHKVRSGADMDGFSGEVRRALSSQVLAFIGNIVALIPLAFLFDFILFTAFGRHFLSAGYAEKTVAALHPLLSLALPLGALTGVLLWLSSLAGGWLENWIVYRRLPQALAAHRKLRYVFGEERAARFAVWLQEHASGIGANVSLGFLFGFVPLLGSLTGLPLDSKHVTISSTSAVLAFAGLPGAPGIGMMVFLTCISLLLIGVMNLAVSFALALVVAARASAVHPRRFRILMKWMGRRLIGLR